MFKKILMGAVVLTSISTVSNAQVFDPTALNADPKTADGPLSPKLTGLVTIVSPSAPIMLSRSISLIRASALSSLSIIRKP